MTRVLLDAAQGGAARARVVDVGAKALAPVDGVLPVSASGEQGPGSSLSVGTCDRHFRTTVEKDC